VVGWLRRVEDWNSSCKIRRFRVVCCGVIGLAACYGKVFCPG